MSRLKIFRESNPAKPEFESEVGTTIQNKLKEAGIRFEQWLNDQEVNAGDAPEVVMQAYQHDIDVLCKKEGYQTVDVISMSAEHPDKLALREKFLSEHRHTEDEVRFFVGGQGLFSLHLEDKVYELLCTEGDLIGVPANTPHWFDMGANPHFVAIRFFNNTEGWVAHYTGSDIAEEFSRLVN